MKTKSYMKLLSLLLSLTMIFTAITPTIASAMDNSNINDLIIETSENLNLTSSKIENFNVNEDFGGTHVEYETEINNQNFKVIELISDDFKTVESKFYLETENGYVLNDIQIQNIADDNKSYTIEKIMINGIMPRTSNITEYEIEEPTLVEDFDSIERSYVWRQVGSMRTGSIGIHRNATVSNIATIIITVFSIAKPVVGAVMGMARKLYNDNRQRYYYNQRIYRNPEGNRAKESIWAYRNSNFSGFIDNIVEVFPHYW